MDKIEVNLKTDNDTSDEKSDNIMNVSVVDNNGKRYPQNKYEWNYHYQKMPCWDWEQN